ncbi:MAG: hypothetical protein ACK5Z5_03735 [Neisseriaceae bacterium]
MNNTKATSTLNTTVLRSNFVGNGKDEIKCEEIIYQMYGILFKLKTISSDSEKNQIYKELLDIVKNDFTTLDHNDSLFSSEMPKELLHAIVILCMAKNGYLGFTVTKDEIYSILNDLKVNGNWIIPISVDIYKKWIAIIFFKGGEIFSIQR